MGSGLDRVDTPNIVDRAVTGAKIITGMNPFFEGTFWQGLGISEAQCTNLGCLVQGYVSGAGFIQADSEGALAHGAVLNGSDIYANGKGSVALGYAEGGADSDVKSSDDGSFAQGCSVGSSFGLLANGKGAFVQGYCDIGGGEYHMSAVADGSFVQGYWYTRQGGATNFSASFEGTFVQGYNKDSWLFAQHRGAMVQGYVSCDDGSAQLGANSEGSFSQGYVSGTQSSINATDGCLSQGKSVAGSSIGGGGRGCINQGYADNASRIRTHGSGNNGSIAQGYADNGSDIFTEAKGAIAQGYVANGADDDIKATGDGAFARGCIIGAFSIIASGDGAIAMGYASAANIEATAAGAIQFGEGVNAEPHSMRVKGSPRLCGDGAPSSPADGDIWVDGGRVYVRTNGVTKDLTNVT